MRADMKFKTTCSFYVLIVTVLFHSILEVNSIYCVNATQISRPAVRYEPVCKRVPAYQEYPYGYDGYIWEEPDINTGYKCVDEEDPETISKDTQMCNFVGFKCITVTTGETKTFYRRKILPSPDGKSPDDVKFTARERYDINVTDCQCMMPLNY